MAKIMVVGCGSIGSRHVRNLKSLGHEVLACECLDDRRNFLEKEFDVDSCPSIEAGSESGVDGVIIASPSHLHFEQAVYAVENGLPVMVEKPITTRLDQTFELERIVKKHGGKLLNGFNMRFHPAIRMVKKMLDDGVLGTVYALRAFAGYYLPDWHPESDYRKSYSANLSMGGGSLLDGIHELDYLHYFFGPVSQVFCIGGTVSNLEIDTEDMVEMTMKTESGVHLAVHMNYLNRTRQREFQVVGEKGIIRWDSTDGTVRLFDADKKCWLEYGMAFEFHINDTYLEEVRHFGEIAEGRADSINDETDGRAVMTVVDCAKESMATNNNVVLDRFLADNGLSTNS